MSTVRTTAGGILGAMAMTGARQVTTGLGLVERTPPDAVVRRTTRGLIGALPKRRRQAAIELAHWGYGGLAGAAYAAVPANVRAKPAAGPGYGLAIWLVFELGIAPLLGLTHAKRPRVGERIAFAADHALYGAVLALSDRPSPAEPYA